MYEDGELIINFTYYYKSSIECGVKHATSRMKRYPVEIGDIVRCRYVEHDCPDFYIEIKDIKEIRFKYLENSDALYEGYLNKGLLKQVLKSHYPQIKGDDIIYQYIFEYRGV